ncbi:hypothetical protein PPYR_13214 [Photinus pyralis]|uniref:Uncharacterized protein n=1 Tax=Photinus pyralis TaxID=7054 RepID=A0A5N4A8F1_PHOPY|nr:hypothetical protein PPYR_13214 [Photinus pyralis]
MFALMVFLVALTQTQSSKRTFKQCVDESNISFQHLEDLLVGTSFANNTAVHAFCFCQLERLDLMTGDGKVHLSPLKRMCQEYKTEECEEFDKCERLTGRTKEETAFLIYKCIFPL